MTESPKLLQEMNTKGILADLRAERDKLDKAITALEAQ